MSLTSLGLSKFLVTAFAIGGTSYSISKVVGNSSYSADDSLATEQSQVSQVTAQNLGQTQRRGSVPAPKKTCSVFLTSVDGFYQVVSCSESNSKTWYLFNKNQGSLDKIQGLTSQNNGSPVKLNYSLESWKSKKWTGIKEYNRRLYKVEKKLEGTFELNFNHGESVFPFFQYLKSNGVCVKSLSYTRIEDPVEFSCQSFDITTEQFEKRLEEDKYKKAFKTNGDQKCYAQKNSKWEETSCDNEAVSSR